MTRAQVPDVTVVGAGPAGSVAALLPARAGVRVSLIARDLSRPVLGEGLPPAARPVLERLGIDLGSEHLRSPGMVSCWGSREPTETAFLQSPFGAGWHLDRTRFDDRLRALAVDSGAIVASAGRRGRVVLDSTGRASAVVRAQGAGFERTDRLVSVVGLLVGRRADHDARTYVGSSHDGWWFSSPLPDGRRVAGFQTDRDLLDRDLVRQPARCLAALRSLPVLDELAAGARVDGTLRVVAADSRRMCWPDDRADLLAAGDADMAFDPLSSLGILAAIQSAEETTPVVLAVLNGGGPDLDTAIDARSTSRDARWSRYQGDLALHYRSERRWPDAPFWARRVRSPDGRPMRYSGGVSDDP